MRCGTSVPRNAATQLSLSSLNIELNSPLHFRQEKFSVSHEAALQSRDNCGRLSFSVSHCRRSSCFPLSTCKRVRRPCVRRHVCVWGLVLFVAVFGAVALAPTGAAILLSLVQENNA